MASFEPNDFANFLLMTKMLFYLVDHVNVCTETHQALRIARLSLNLEFVYS